MRHAIPILLLAVLLPTAGVAENQPPMIHVDGQAVVRVSPDRAIVRLGVEMQRPTAAEAQDATDAAAGAIFEALLSLGVSEASIQTSGLTLQPVYSQRRPDGEPYVPELIGYRAGNTVQLTLTDLQQTGPAIDTAIRAGANRVLGITFALDDDVEARREALRKAVAKAASKAETIAAALGRKLGDVVEVREGGVQVRPVAGRLQAEMAMDAGTPVAPGEIGISASVTILWKLDD